MANLSSNGPNYNQNNYLFNKERLFGIDINPIYACLLSLRMTFKFKLETGGYSFLPADIHSIFYLISISINKERMNLHPGSGTFWSLACSLSTYLIRDTLRVRIWPTPVFEKPFPQETVPLRDVLDVTGDVNEWVKLKSTYLIDKKRPNRRDRWKLKTFFCLRFSLDKFKVWKMFCLVLVSCTGLVCAETVYEYSITLVWLCSCKRFSPSRSRSDIKMFGLNFKYQRLCFIVSPDLVWVLFGVIIFSAMYRHRCIIYLILVLHLVFFVKIRLTPKMLVTSITMLIRW